MRVKQGFEYTGNDTVSEFLTENEGEEIEITGKNGDNYIINIDGTSYTVPQSCFEEGEDNYSDDDYEESKSYATLFLGIGAVLMILLTIFNTIFILIILLGDNKKEIVEESPPTKYETVDILDEQLNKKANKVFENQEELKEYCDTELGKSYNSVRDILKQKNSLFNTKIEMTNENTKEN